MVRLSVSAAFNSIDRGMWIYRWKPIIVPITGGIHKKNFLIRIAFVESSQTGFSSVHPLRFSQFIEIYKTFVKQTRMRNKLVLIVNQRTSRLKSSLNFEIFSVNQFNCNSNITIFL